MKQRVLFLDRDGIINEDFGYVYKKEDFVFVDGIFELLKLFQTHGYLLFIITNQSGIGRGYYTQNDFSTLTSWMLQEFQKHDIFISQVKYCPHAPEYQCECRKPKTGMIDEILDKYQIDLQNSWLIGDKQSDIDLGVNAHIVNRIYIGKESIIKNYTLKFDTIASTLHFFQTNSDKIQ